MTDTAFQLTIRAATPADGFLMEALTRKIWTPRVAPPSTVYGETGDTVTAQIEQGGGIVLEQLGVPIGSGRWVNVPGPQSIDRWMEVKRIGVLPGFTGRGLGAEILHALESQGREAGMAGSQLAVRFDQTRLVSYYGALGYSVAGDVILTTINRDAPPPTGMRKRF